MARKLNQVIALETGVRKSTGQTMTRLDGASRKPALFMGLSRTYTPLDAEDPDVLPPDHKRVQVRYVEQFNEARRALGELFTLAAAKDWGNCEARADVVVEGAAEPLLTGVPVTHLLFLENQLNDLRTFVTRIPTLDPAYDWSWDANAQIFKSEPQQQNRTRKTPKPVTLSEPTKEHPAQVQLVHEDVVIGHTHTTYHSGAIPLKRQRELLDRIELVGKAIKSAREAANLVEAPNRVATELLDYIFEENEAS